MPASRGGCSTRKSQRSLGCQLGHGCQLVGVSQYVALCLPSMKHEAPKARLMCSRNEELLEISRRPLFSMLAPSASWGSIWLKHHVCNTYKKGEVKLASFWKPKNGCPTTLKLKVYVAILHFFRVISKQILL